MDLLIKDKFGLNTNTTDCWLFVNFWEDFFKLCIEQLPNNYKIKSKKQFMKYLGFSGPYFFKVACRCSWLEFPKILKLNSNIFLKIYANHKTITNEIGIKNMSMLIKNFSQLTEQGCLKYEEVLLSGEFIIGGEGK